MKMPVSWVVMLSILLEVYQLIALMKEAASTSGTPVNFYQATAQKTAIFIPAMVRTSIPTLFSYHILPLNFFFIQHI
jgi:hypothetical protein